MKGGPSSENLYEESLKYALDDSAHREHEHDDKYNSDTNNDIDNLALEVHDQGFNDEYEDAVEEEQ